MRISLVSIVWKPILRSGSAASIVLLARWLGWRTHGMVDLVLQAAAYLTLCGVAALITTPGPIRTVLEAMPFRRSSDRAAASAERPPRDELSRSGRHPTHRQLAFPLAVRADDCGSLWVTTRDWPALGRMNLDTGRWQWTDLPPFPHLATPDGEGGCWTALTRASAIVHVDATESIDRSFTVPRTRELLGSALASGSLWVVDAARRTLLRLPLPAGAGADVDASSPTPRRLLLPDCLRRPDIVVPGVDGRLWVGDTSVAIAAVVEPATENVSTVQLPHATRWLLADAERGGMWLGASGRSQISLVDSGGTLQWNIDPDGVPFDLARLPDGRLLAALKDASTVAVIDPDRDTVDHVELPAGSGPSGLAVVGDRCFVTLS